jgi:hypothetical protein
MDHIAPEPEEQEGYIEFGNLADCSGVSESSRRIGANALLDSKVAPASGGIATDFGRAKKVTMSVGSWTWDQIVAGPFARKLQGMGSDNQIYKDIKAPGVFVTVKALRVKDLTADLEFESTVAVQLQGKYSGSIALAGGEAAIGLHGTWISETTLRITAASDFYLAAEIARYDEDVGLAGDDEWFVRVPVDRNAQVMAGN